MGLPHILIVDDDRDCRRLLRRLLDEQYRVSEVGSAEAALELVLYGQGFDAVLCDLTMDGWSGADLYTRLVRRGNAHASRFVILSGDDVPARRPDLAAALGERILRKPFSAVALHRMLSNVLAGVAAPSQAPTA